MGDTPPVPPTEPVDREALAEKILSGELTHEESGALWGALADPSIGDKYQRLDLVSEFAEDCITVTMIIVGSNNPAWREALAALARGQGEDAANRFESMIGVAEEDKAKLLYMKAALFTFVDAAVATNAIARAMKLQPGNSTLGWWLGRIQEALGELDAAEATQQGVLELEKKAAEPGNAGKTLEVLARIATTRGDASRAAERRREAVELFEKAGDRANAAGVHRLLAEYHESIREPDIARSHYDRALAHYEALDEKAQAADTILDIADLEFRRDNHDEALAMSERVRDLGHTLGAGRTEARGWAGIALVHMVRGKSADAEAACRSAEALFLANGDEGGRARVLWTLGAVLEDGPAALESLRQAEQLFEKLGEQDDLTAVRAAIAQLEPPKPKSPPPPSKYPPNTREYFWDRITDGYLTEDDAGAMLAFVTRAAQATADGRELMKGAPPADDFYTQDDFQDAVLDISGRADAREGLVLVKLVGGEIDDAALSWQAIVKAAGEEKSPTRLWMTGALFVAVRPALAREAWKRLLDLEPDDHYERCIYARLLDRMGDTAGAEAAFREVLQRAGDDEVSIQAMATDGLGQLALGRDDLDAAVTYFERALQLYRKLERPRAVRVELRILGLIAEKRRDPVVAEAYFREALGIAEQTGDASAVALLHGDLADVAEQKGDIAAAEASVKRALEQYEKLGQPTKVATAWSRLGDLAAKCEDYETADNHYDRERAIYQGLGDDAGTAHAFGCRGRMMALLDEYGDAEWLFKTAASLYEKVGKPADQAVMLEKLGWAHYFLEDHAQASTSWNRALELYATLGLEDNAASLRKDIAEARDAE